MIRREAAIVGIGQTEYAKALPPTAWELAVEAVLAALGDAGVDPADVDGMCRFVAPFETVSEAMLVRSLGIRELSFFAQAPHGGEALGAVVAHAAAAVSAGLTSVVVVYRALSQSTGGRFGRADRGGYRDPGWLARTDFALEDLPRRTSRQIRDNGDMPRHLVAREIFPTKMT